VLGHNGYLSLARELSLTGDDTLATTFIPELTKLRIATSHQTLAGGGAERVGDTLLLPGRGSAQMEVRFKIEARVSASTDAFGIAVKSQVAASGAYMLESTRIGVSPNLRVLFIDRSYTNSNSSETGWPQTGANDKRVADQPVMSYPLDISRGEAVEIVVIVDGGIVEVCANNRSVVAALALSGSSNSTRVGVFGLPSTATVHAEAWELTPLYLDSTGQ
jgi:sucrose-6-phosphate hydrolase SacC (GH32 family)